MPHRPLPKDANFPQLEEQILERWRERDVYNESMRRREGAPPYVFYEGPPTANGRPGSHHVLARVFKDIFPRYKTMQGFYSSRKGGWDCHGLPVEIAVQEQLGIENKQQIEEYGIAEFNAKCRESVFEFLEDWTKLTERIGYWVDLDDPYRTLDTDYIESVWWALKQLWDKDLLYEGFKVVPYCPRDGTSLSSHEVSQGYKDVEDPSVYVRYPITKPAGALREGDNLLVWTTTPWTLVSNAAVAVDPELTYVRSTDGYVLAEALVGRVLGEDAEVADRFTGAEMVGAAYEPPFGFIPASAYGDKGHTVLPADFVSAEDGTGIVHTAIAFGEDDFRLGAEHGLNVVNPVKADGTYDERIGPYENVFVKHADDDLIKDLEARGRMFRSERLLHSYPHCWRCGTPLLYYAKPTWFIRMSAVKDRLLAANETVDWHPEHIKHGRFGRWLENNVDWALGRERYWGTPLPIWRNEAGETIGGRLLRGAQAALRRAGRRPAPPVRRRRRDPEPDRRRAAAPRARGDRRLVRLGLDAVRAVARAVREPGQVRGAVPRRLHLRGDRPDARLVLQPDRDLDAAVRPELLQDVPLPRPHRRSRRQEDVEVARQHRRALGRHRPPRRGRLPLVLPDQQAAVGRLPVQHRHGRRVAAPVPAAALEHVRLLRDVRERQRRRAGRRRAGQRPRPLGAVSRLAATVEIVTERLDNYDATRAGQAIAAFVDDLSNWYVRRSRRRFWDGDAAAFATLRTCLVTVTKLLAPFTPFVADEIYDNLDGSEPSVHLTDWPKAGERDTDLEFAMATVRETVRLGLAARGQAKLKVRQPLRAAVVVAAGSERAAIERLADVALEELNVKELRYVSQADELGSYEVKPNYRALGPRFGKSMPQVAAAVAALDPQHVAGALRDGGRVGISIDGHDHELSDRRPAARHAPARGLPARARGLARRGARARARRRRCAARAWPARSSTRSRTPARTPACRSRTGSRWCSAARTSCSRPPASTSPT